MAKVMIKHNQLWNHRKVKLCIGKTDFSTRWIFGYRQTLDTVYSLHWHCQIFHCCRKNWKLAKPSWKHSKDVDFISCHKPFKLCKECMQGYICKWWKNCLQNFLTCTNSLLITGTIPLDGVAGFEGELEVSEDSFGRYRPWSNKQERLSRVTFCSFMLGQVVILHLQYTGMVSR